MHGSHRQRRAKRRIDAERRIDIEPQGLQQPTYGARNRQVARMLGCTAPGSSSQSTSPAPIRAVQSLLAQQHIGHEREPREQQALRPPNHFDPSGHFRDVVVAAVRRPRCAKG